MRPLVAILALLAVAFAGCRGSSPSTGVVVVTVTPAPATALTDGGGPTTARRTPRIRSTPGAQRPLVAGCRKPADPGDSLGTLAYAGETRSYRLHIPARYDSRRPTPLVFSFHGYAQTAEQQDLYSELPALADQQTFILLTPEGSGDPEGWNIVDVYNENGTDDVGFVSALVVAMGDTLCIDPSRIYATGHSNGAEMASQVACDLPAIFAAVAPVSGAVFQSCAGPGVPIIAFQGTDDYNVPFDDSDFGVWGWVGHNGCPAEPEVSSPAEGVELRSWSCSEGDVEFYVLEGVGHVWPGGDPSIGGVGAATDAVNASALMWEFFRSHPHR